MSKRLKIQCWNCPKTYFESLDTTQDEVMVKCPYCNTRGKVTLKPYRRQSNTSTIYRGENNHTQGDEEFQFPDVLPSKKTE